MKHILLLVALLFSLAACATDLKFDVSRLTPEHQAIFQQAGDDLNAKYGSDFSAGSQGLNYVKYGGQNDGDGATTFEHPNKEHPFWWYVALSVDFHNWKPDRQYQIARHELCHVIGFDHENGNPLIGHC